MDRKLQQIRQIVMTNIKDPGEKTDYWGNEDDAESHGFECGQYFLAQAILKVLDE